MNLPPDFTRQILSLLGQEEGEELLAALRGEPVVSLRLNAAKAVAPTQLAPVPWCNTGYYLPRRPAFTFDPLFHAGHYYPQEAASMFPGQGAAQLIGSPVLALDLCAAPGGKSTHLRSILPEGSLLVCNEVIRGRASILVENMTKWGHPDVVITNSDPSCFRRAGALFDLVLADVPCSGEGMFRKDPASVGEWSMANVELCRQRQQRIIADVWPALKPGGLLIYSTCTFNTAENEENVSRIMRQQGASPVSLTLPEAWNITGNRVGEDFPVYRFFPHKTKGEGFFMAILRKEGEGETPADALQKRRSTPPPSNPKGIEKAKEWLLAPEEYRWWVSGSRIMAAPRCYESVMPAIEENSRVVQKGIFVGEQKGKDFIPSQALALSTALNTCAFHTAEVSYEQAIRFLRKEAVALEASAPRGYTLITYKGAPLGFVKNLGNRANNLYPGEWRIRSGYAPEGEVMI